MSSWNRSASAEPDCRRRSAIWLWVGAGVMLIAAANVHLVYVAVTSQPACVPHFRPGEATDGVFGAAQSACKLEPDAAAPAQQ